MLPLFGLLASFLSFPVSGWRFLFLVFLCFGVALAAVRVVNFYFPASFRLCFVLFFFSPISALFRSAVSVLQLPCHRLGVEDAVVEGCER